jgi:hypothetical protein
MLNKSIGSTQTPASRIQFWSTPHRLILTIMWLITTVAMVTMLLLDVRDTNRYSEARYVLQAGYVAALLLYLSRSGPSISQLPQLRPFIPGWRYSAWIPVLVIALLLALTTVSDDEGNILMLLMIVATVWILIAWRRQIRFRSVVQSLALALIAYIAGLSMRNNGFISETVLYLLVILVPPMYIAGGLLVDRTHLGGVQLLANRYIEALLSFLWGCLMFIPLGLFNAAGGSPGANITWVSEWWMPISLPWFSAITEETWFRLLLVGLCYFLLRPAFTRRPAVPIIIAVLFSAITFGLGHDGTFLDRFLVTGLLYGLPMAVVFARRDWEHAVGAHYMINMIPWMMVYFETL